MLPVFSFVVEIPEGGEAGDVDTVPCHHSAIILPPYGWLVQLVPCCNKLWGTNFTLFMVESPPHPHQTSTEKLLVFLKETIEEAV